MVENKVCENTLAKAQAAAAETFKSGDVVTYGKSTLEWTVDSVNYGMVYMNRQHGKVGNGHHLSFKQVPLEDAPFKLHKVTFPDEPEVKHFTVTFTEGELAAVYTALTVGRATENAAAARDKVRDVWRKQ